MSTLVPPTPTYGVYDVPKHATLAHFPGIAGHRFMASLAYPTHALARVDGTNLLYRRLLELLAPLPTCNNERFTCFFGHALVGAWEPVVHHSFISLWSFVTGLAAS